MFKDFIALLYPDLCYSCSKALYNNEEGICTYCRYHLPKTKFHLEKGNPVSRMFWGRVNIEGATALYYFSKGGKVQHMIHQLKYRGKKEVGTAIGRIFGHDLNVTEPFNDIDCIVPVPLHPKKLRKRGYNQSACIATGLTETMGKPTLSNLLHRVSANTTQTKKSHYERWENVESIFQVDQAEKQAGKHFLLVDDVVTTGSTLEACAHALLAIPDTKVSIATLAFTE